MALMAYSLSLESQIANSLQLSVVQIPEAEDSKVAGFRVSVGDLQ